MSNLLNGTNEKIRYVAFKFFLEKGYEATNIRDICTEVDIKTSSLYFYYKSKKELFFNIYDEICNENINQRLDILKLNQNINPNMKLHLLYKEMLKYYIHNMAKQKYLLRFHLFPPEEVSIIMREKYKRWISEENKIIMDVVNQCVELKILSDKNRINDYAEEYLKYEKLQVSDMIISNIKMSDTELDKSWVRFWDDICLF